MRLIDADALIEHLKEMWGKWDEDDWYEAQAKDAMQDDIRIVEKQPTIDAVPVDFMNQKIVELQSCAIQHFNDGHEILATCVWETIRLLGSFLKEWRGKEKTDEQRI